MPRVTLKVGLADGPQEELSEYVCDWPDCPNIATHVLGCVREFGLSAVVCDQHAAGSGGAPAGDSNRTA